MTMHALFKEYAEERGSERRIGYVVFVCHFRGRQIYIETLCGVQTTESEVGINTDKSVECSTPI
jgi:hypothetical protein